MLYGYLKRLDDYDFFEKDSAFSATSAESKTRYAIGHRHPSSIETPVDPRVARRLFRMNRTESCVMSASEGSGVRTGVV